MVKKKLGITKAEWSLEVYVVLIFFELSSLLFHTIISDTWLREWVAKVPDFFLTNFHIPLMSKRYWCVI